LPASALATVRGDVEQATAARRQRRMNIPEQVIGNRQRHCLSGPRLFQAHHCLMVARKASPPAGSFINACR
jgi:hypothetical protein